MLRHILTRRTWSIWFQISSEALLYISVAKSILSDDATESRGLKTTLWNPVWSSTIFEGSMVEASVIETSVHEVNQAIYVIKRCKLHGVFVEDGWNDRFTGAISGCHNISNSNYPLKWAKHPSEEYKLALYVRMQCWFTVLEWYWIKDSTRFRRSSLTLHLLIVTISAKRALHASWLACAYLTGCRATNLLV